MIVLRAKNVEFEVTYVNLREKPDWFLEISPHGKVPVLNVDDQPLFESNAIAEYLDETVEPRLHPAEPIKRARNRAWTDFVPDFAEGMRGIYYARSAEAVAEGVETAGKRVAKLEEAIARERGNDGPWFNGDRFSMVDAAYAPFLMRFDLVERVLETGLLRDFPRVRAWSDALLADDIVTGSVPESFRAEFVANGKRLGTEASRYLDAGPAAAD